MKARDPRLIIMLQAMQPQTAGIEQHLVNHGLKIKSQSAHAYKISLPDAHLM